MYRQRGALSRGKISPATLTPSLVAAGFTEEDIAAGEGGTRVLLLEPRL